jgi:hypothetical protein
MFELLLILVSFAGGWIAREAYASYRIEKLLDRLEADEEFDEEYEDEDYVVEPESDLCHVVIEQHNGAFFVYRREDYRFLTQANTLDDLKVNLAKLMPGKKFGITPDNLKELGVTSI